MTDAERTEQVASQCEVVWHLAMRLAQDYLDWATQLRRRTDLPSLETRIGDSSARVMEDLRAELDNEIDDDTGWVRQVFAKAHILWPQE